MGPRAQGTGQWAHGIKSEKQAKAELEAVKEEMEAQLQAQVQAKAEAVRVVRERHVHFALPPSRRAVSAVRAVSADRHQPIANWGWKGKAIEKQEANGQGVNV